jgi:hypothetical protein
MRSSQLGWVALALVALAGCGAMGGTGLLREYEYEEEIYLDLDGSATVIVNASVPALVALRGLDLDPRPRARLDRQKIQAAYGGPSTRVTRVGRPWRRHGRRFVQVRLEVADIRQLGTVAPFAWSTYQLARAPDEYVYTQRLAAASGRPVGDVGWTGAELVAVRIHLPSRIHFHNAPSRTVERGNILSWEQPLQDRLNGSPLAIEVRMATQTILYSTLWLFAMAFATALATLGVTIWWVVKKKDEPAIAS